jgi:hypothetical protein
MAGLVIDAALHLLDRQILDRDGLMAGNVDDLELRFPEDGAGPPIVTAILSGPGALARRIGGRFGHWLEHVHARLHREQEPGPARMSFGVVKRLGDHVEVTIPRTELESYSFERWVGERIIGKIPGADRAAD